MNTAPLPMGKIGKYDLVCKIGEGMTATVYLATDSFAHREVAIKVFSPEILKDPERGKIYTRLLLNEASLVGKLNHPHIVQIFDAEVSGSLCYLVMEYVPGGTLDAFCHKHTLLPVERVVEIIFKCTRALDFACRLGITHRDIKPANILISESDANTGDIKISDFGAAITHGHDSTHISGVGSPAYMSPEQVRELPLDVRTDIYSLGVVMYQMLTGQLPFQADNNYNMVYQIINTPVPPVCQVRKDLSPAIGAIVEKAMMKNMDERYQTWDEFSYDLAHAFRRKARVPTSADAPFSDSEKFGSLRALPFFHAFTDIEIWEIVRFSQWKELSPGDVLMKEGEEGDFFGFISEGELKVTKGGKILDLLTAGDCFGEMAVISKNSSTRGADVVALTLSSVIMVNANSLTSASEICRMHFYQGFLEVLAQRLTFANQRLANN